METKYHLTVGLEIHAELKTETKMFCNSKNDPDEKCPNVNVCPVCMAHPGTLPVINKKAVEHVIRVGLALGGNIANDTNFDRKNYFYPDIPKAYQISQYKSPIVSGGELNGVKITRVHLEEDTATSKHGTDGSLVDFNRAGVPLMELVTEPCIHTAEDAGAFAKELQTLLWYLDVSEANMEKGEMRVEANISISSDPNKFGTKVEVKNLNSFRSVERAITYEVNRMSELLDAGRGEEIVQETRGWDEVKQATFSQRTKENSEDYRYFPDPDLPRLKLHSAFDIEKLKSELPELPKEKRERYANDYGIKPEDIETFINDPSLASWFESVASKLMNPDKIRLATNYITSDLLGLMKTNPEANFPSAETFAELILMAGDGVISSRGAKDILAMIAIKDSSPKSLAEKHGFIQTNDIESIKKIAIDVIDANPGVVSEYKAGKTASIQFLVGQCMKASKGSANPAMLKEILESLLTE